MVEQEPVCVYCSHLPIHHDDFKGKCLVSDCRFKCESYIDSKEIYTDWIPLAANLSPDAPTVTNSKGGKQSQLTLRFDLLDTKAMFRLASILNYGANKYGDNNWRNIEVQDHLNHALTHIFAYLAGDTQDDHLGHAFCRLMMAVGTEHDSKES